MPGVRNLADVLPWSVDGLDERPFAEQQFIPQPHAAILHLPADCGQASEALCPEPIMQRWGDRAPIPTELAEERLGPLWHGPSVIDMARGDTKRQPLADIVHKQVECDTIAPSQRRLAPGRPARTHFVRGNTTIVTDRQRGRIDAGNPRTPALAGGR